jgi:hypothetical protein
MPGTDLRPAIQMVPRTDYRPIAVMSVNSMPRYKSFVHDAAHALQVGLASKRTSVWRHGRNALERKR